MREILFRGQTRKKGEIVKMDGSPVPGNWVYGGICQGSGDYSIIYGQAKESTIDEYVPIEKYVVYSESIGEYTGLNDKNGTKIFEGDICTIIREDGYFEVMYDKMDAKYVFVDPVESLMFDMDTINSCELEIIGNIFDNPELLEE